MAVLMLTMGLILPLSTAPGVLRVDFMADHGDRLERIKADPSGFRSWADMGPGGENVNHAMEWNAKMGCNQSRREAGWQGVCCH
jgi:hypothetical protein